MELNRDDVYIILDNRMVTLREAIQTMKPTHKLFVILKEELEAQGRWKKLPRGIPGFKARVQDVPGFKEKNE